MVMRKTPVKLRCARAASAALGVVVLAALFVSSAMALPTGSPSLPDGRGYEEVSSKNNADGNVYQDWPVELANTGGWTRRPFISSLQGDALAYIGSAPEVGGTGIVGGNYGNQYLARRGADGRWQAENITPPSEAFLDNPIYQGFSPDLSHGFLATNPNLPLTPGAPGGKYKVPYARDTATGAYQALLSAAPPNRTPSSFGAFEIGTASGRNEPVFAGSSADASHILLIANDALTPDAIDEGSESNNLYDFAENTLRLVNVLPNGTPEPNAIFGGPVVAPSEAYYNSPDFSHVISTDGSRIFWTGQGSNRNLYMRENGSTTVQIDAGVGGKGQFWTATPDGSKVLFAKEGDLYTYDVETGQTSRLTSGAEFQGVVGTSEDLSYIYFVADGAMANGATQGNCATSTVEGECSLYVLHVGEPVKFIARLSAKDDEAEPNSFYEYDGDWQGGLANREAEVTPDGQHLLFTSIRSLTGYENEHAEELFVYELGKEDLDCISCDRSGASSVERLGGAFLPVSNQDFSAANWMSKDGGQVFFNSLDPLVSQDTNGRSDVYEWERDGVAGCGETLGCVSLISGGTAPEGSYLIGSSESGDDVFFTTRAKFVEEDQNENIDVYDAHVGAVAPPSPTQCTGTGCQGVPSSPPVFATPSSVTYTGVGNFPAAAKAAVETKPVAKHKAKKSKKPTKKRRKAKKKRKVVGRAKKSRNVELGRGK